MTDAEAGLKTDAETSATNPPDDPGSPGVSRAHTIFLVSMVLLALLVTITAVSMSGGDSSVVRCGYPQVTQDRNIERCADDHDDRYGCDEEGMFAHREPTCCPDERGLFDAEEDFTDRPLDRSSERC